MATIGVIGGGGWLAGALLTPALEDSVIRPRQLILSSRSGEIAGFEDWPEIDTTNDNEALVARADIVVLCVRPQDLDETLRVVLPSSTGIGLGVTVLFAGLFSSLLSLRPIPTTATVAPGAAENDLAASRG